MNGVTTPPAIPAEPAPAPAAQSGGAPPWGDPLRVRREDVRRSLRAKTEALLLQRLRIALVLTLASYALFLANDVVRADANLRMLVWIKVVQVAGVGSLLALLASARAKRHLVALALTATLFIAAAATASAIVRGAPSALALLLVALTIGTATMYPWGARAQAVVVGSCLLLMLLTVHAVEGSVLSILARPTTAALLTAVAISVYLARDSERYRWQIEERELGLRMREEHFRTLIESASDLLVLLNADGKVRSVSPAVRDLLGFAAKQWIGKPLSEFVHPEDVETLRDTVAASRSSAGPLSAEIRIRDAGSTWHVLLITIADLLGHAAVEGIVLHARDISARKAMELELRRSEAALSALIESTSDSVWSVDREGRLTAMNAAVRHSYKKRYGCDVRVGQSFADRAPAEIAAQWRELYDRVLAGERVTSEQAFEQDGELRHYLISMNPIRDSGEVTGAVVFSRDITELRQAAELARRNQAELTHVLRLGTIGEMASGLAHEINQPLGAIANYAAACNRRLGAGDLSTPELQRGLELIACEALRAGEIIRRLRDLARKGEVAMVMVEPENVVRSAVALIEPEARLQGIAVRVETARDLPRLYVDPIQVEQVILNLLLNAIEAMQGSTVKRLVVESRRVNGSVEICVRDSGVGLGEEGQARLFEPFYTTKAQGLGMGLAISRRIVEAHGGQLTGSANGEGGGSVFRFTLPLPH